MRFENLPSNWILFRLDEICEINIGQSPPSSSYNYNQDGLPFFQGKTDFGPFYPTKRVWCNEPKKIVDQNDILLSVRAPVGPTNIAIEKSCIGRGLCGLKFLLDENSKFIFYFFRSIENELSQLGTGSTFQAISKSQISNLKFPLPPLPEQHRIVAKLEELFTKLDVSVAELKKAKAQIKRYRQSVLKHAFEGKLVNPDDSFKSNLRDWKWIKLEEVAEAIDPQPSHRTPPKAKEEGIPYIGMREIDKEERKINFQNARKVSAKVLAEHIERYTIDEGDFIIGKIGTIGIPVKIPSDRFYALSANVVLIKPNKSFCSGSFLFYLLDSPLIENQFMKGAKATTQSAFGIQKVRKLDIQLPPLHEQQSIVNEIERHFSVADETEKLIDQSLKQSERLRQSILKDAFTGKLVPQDPNEEPASVLLERIKEEREKLNKEVKPKKRKGEPAEKPQEKTKKSITSGRRK